MTGSSGGASGSPAAAGSETGVVGMVAAPATGAGSRSNTSSGGAPDRVGVIGFRAGFGTGGGGSAGFAGGVLPDGSAEASRPSPTVSLAFDRPETTAPPSASEARTASAETFSARADGPSWM